MQKLTSYLHFQGNPALYVSRDGGLTWKLVLQDYYFFNMGDHGGVLVAVKYFKNKGETKEMYYSTDEGDTWRNIEFNDKMLKVYGLMTEPGENTTVFTMFGSGSGQHQWLIIKVDLRNVFAKNCTEDDYKFWTPTSGNVSFFITHVCKKFLQHITVLANFLSS